MWLSGQSCFGTFQTLQKVPLSLIAIATSSIPLLATGQEVYFLSLRLPFLGSSFKLNCTVSVLTSDPFQLPVLFRFIYVVACIRCLFFSLLRSTPLFEFSIFIYPLGFLWFHLKFAHKFYFEHMIFLYDVLEMELLSYMVSFFLTI